MSVTAGEVQAILTLRDELSPALALANQAMRNFANETKGASDAVQVHTDLMPSFVSKYIEARTIWEAATVAYRDLVGLITRPVESYGLAEQAEVRLSAALDNTGVA